MNKVPWHKSIRYREIVLLIGSFFIVVTLITSVLVIHNRRSVRFILNELEIETIGHISTVIESNLSKGKHILNLHFNAISYGQFSENDLTQLENLFIKNLKQDENIARIFVALSDGSFYGARRMPDGTLEFFRSDQWTSYQLEYYINQWGERIPLEYTNENFDPRERSWYMRAIKSDGVSYGTPYGHSVFKEPTITASFAYYNEGEELAGVLGLDYLMSWLGHTLSNLVIGENGKIVIVGPGKQLIATSGDIPVFDFQNGKAVPKTIEESEFLQVAFEDIPKNATSKRFRYDDNFYTISSSKVGLDQLGWEIYLFVKESDFLQGCQIARHVVMVSLLILSSIFVTIMIKINRKYVYPIINLNEAAISLRNGRYQTVPETNSRDEIDELIKSFNQMGQQINDQMDFLYSEVRRQTKEAKQAAKEAQEANLAKSRFLAIMSHELRTPLNGFIGMVDLMKMTKLDDEQLEYMDIAEKSSYALLNVINEVLDYSKIEADKIELEKIPVSIKELSNRVQMVTMPLVKKFDNSFELFIGDQTPDKFLGDPLKLSQIFINLVSNASKFTKNGIIGLSVCLVTVDSLNTGENQQMLEFSVTDTGIGIPKEKLEEIFQPFVQVDNTTTRKYGGTGLGLAISHKLVHLMGGNIWVESQEGKGSRFVIRIPFEGYQPSVKEEENPQIELDIDGGQNNIEVLVVEDDEANIYFMQSIGKREGWNVEIAATGKIAVQKATSKLYDIIIMDIDLPELDGLEATKIIRQDSINEGTPILALTASAIRGDETKFIEAGMNAYISKPFEINELRAIVDKLLRT